MSKDHHVHALIHNGCSLEVFKRGIPYLIDVLFVAISAGILFPFRNSLNPTTLALIFLIPVLICTTWWGFVPGIASAILTFLVYNFFFLTPYYTFTVHNSQDIISLGIFLIIAVLISQLVGRSKKSLDLAIAREQEVSRLYELSLSLTGANNPEEAADVVAHKIQETIHSCQAEVIVTEGSFGKSIHVSTVDTCNETAGTPIICGVQLEDTPIGVFFVKTARNSV